MKTLNSVRFTLLAAAALFTCATFAANPPPPAPQPSSGTVVLDLPNASSWGLASAPSGTISAVGVAFGEFPDWRQVVLGSGDGGNNWSVLDDFAPPGRYVDLWSALGGSIVSDSAGNTYISGRSYD